MGGCRSYTEVRQKFNNSYLYPLNVQPVCFISANKASSVPNEKIQSSEVCLEQPELSAPSSHSDLSPEKCLNHCFASDKPTAFPSFLICWGKGTVLDICSRAGVLYLGLIPAMLYVPPPGSQPDLCACPWTPCSSSSRFNMHSLITSGSSFKVGTQDMSWALPL